MQTSARQMTMTIKPPPALASLPKQKNRVISPVLFVNREVTKPSSSLSGSVTKPNHSVSKWLESLQALQPKQKQKLTISKRQNQCQRLQIFAKLCKIHSRKNKKSGFLQK